MVTMCTSLPANGFMASRLANNQAHRFLNHFYLSCCFILSLPLQDEEDRELSAVLGGHRETRPESWNSKIEILHESSEYKSYSWNTEIGKGEES